MNFIETPEVIQGQIEQLTARIHEIEDGTRADKLGRLAAAYPLHPTRLARFLFLLLLIAAIALMMVGLALPFTGEENRELMGDLQRTIPVPIPFVLGILALCMAVAWLASTMAALSVGTDAPLRSWEAEEHRRLMDEVQYLMGQKAVADRVKGTPMGARPRIATPVPLSMRQGAPTPGSAPGRAPTPLGPPRRKGTPLGPPRRGATPMGPPSRAATPLGPPRRGGTPIGTSRRSTGAAPEPGPNYGPPSFSTQPQGTRATRGASPISGTPSGVGTPISSQARARGGTPADMSYGAPKAREKSRDLFGDDGGGEPSYLDAVRSPEIVRPDSNVELSPRYLDTHAPDTGPVDEAWLDDALQKAEILAAGYPVQAYLQYSPEQGLPFALVLERTTPAMGVRAMVAYVEFLASIATPPRARIELKNVTHFDTRFHRNVETALRPYFPTGVRVEQNGSTVEITFDAPDAGWRRYPTLPNRA